MTDTIYALASAPGRAGVSVIRLSGSESVRIAGELVQDMPESRGLRVLRDAGGSAIDQALVLRFAEGRSFTGEEVVELHVHGSMAIVAAVSDSLARHGARLAEAGEFTRRALLNGKLDLAQVEGLADLIDAETEAQRRQAMLVFSGALGQMADQVRHDLIRAAALIEATIDFVDEDVPVDVLPEVEVLLTRTRAALMRQVDGAGAAERIRNGYEVAIVGRPNVGKSTLLNRLAGRPAAITSEIAGTTRDVIEVRMDLGGLPVVLLDTAGIRATEDTVEGLGIALALSRAQAADVRVFLLGEGDTVPFAPMPGDLVLQAKVDMDGPGVSGLTGHGIDEMVRDLTRVLFERSAGAGLIIRSRHLAAMRTAVTLIDTAMATIAQSGQADLIAEDLRSATRAVDMIVGRVDVENLLDEIFRSFCIGK